MIESVMEGDEGINRKNYKELILFSREGYRNGEREIERYRKYIDTLRNLERKRYWVRKILKNII